MRLHKGYSSFLLCPVCAFLLGTALASGDSFLSQQYMDNTFINLMKQVIREGVAPSILLSYQEKLEELESLKAEHLGVMSNTATMQQLPVGGQITFPQGTVFTLLDGVVSLEKTGTLLNLSQGVTVEESMLLVGNQYLVAEDSVVQIRGGMTPVNLSVLGAFTLTESGGAAEGQFFDVTEADWYYDAVEFVKEHSLFSGTSPNYFSPDLSMDRGMMMTVLFRLAGSPQSEMDNATVSFVDVSTEHWFEPYVRWGGAQGLVAGMGDGYFGPSYQVTRQQVAIMLYAFAELYLGLDMSHSSSLEPFEDTDSVASWASNQMAWMVSRGLHYGIPYYNTQLKGNDYASRSEVAMMLMNFYQYIFYVGAEIPRV